MGANHWRHGNVELADDMLPCTPDLQLHVTCWKYYDEWKVKTCCYQLLYKEDVILISMCFWPFTYAKITMMATTSSFKDTCGYLNISAKCHAAYNWFQITEIHNFRNISKTHCAIYFIFWYNVVASQTQNCAYLRTNRMNSFWDIIKNWLSSQKPW